MTAVQLAAWGCAASIVLAGCSFAPLRPPVEDPERAWHQRVASMGTVNGWEMRGRLAVRTEKRGETISMFWRRDRADHTINLYGPMGAGRVILTLDKQGAELRDNKDKIYHDDSAEDLLYRVAGWRVPFRSMQYWVLGIAAPDSEFDKELDVWGRLSSLTQNGWRIEITDYHYYDGVDMPRKLVMNALPGTQHIVDDQGGENDTIQVKAIIRRWEWSRN